MYLIPGMYDNRDQRIQTSEYAKARLCHRDPRWRRNPQYITYAMHLKQMKSVESAIYSCMHGSKTGGMTAGQLATRVKNQDKDLEVKLDSLMAPVVGSKVK